MGQMHRLFSDPESLGNNNDLKAYRILFCRTYQNHHYAAVLGRSPSRERENGHHFPDLSEYRFFSQRSM